jgi:hypothetical protein
MYFALPSGHRHDDPSPFVFFPYIFFYLIKLSLNKIIKLIFKII